MRERMASGNGFVAALDQSGGSTPGALASYGVTSASYGSEDEMFALIHQFRCRILAAPSFDAGSVLGAILFDQTMQGDDGQGGRFVETLVAGGIVPFLKVDAGLEQARDGVQLMKPMPLLHSQCRKALELGVFGTKMRSVILQPDVGGIAAVVEQQFSVALEILEAGLVPILEPEISLLCNDRDLAEDVLLDCMLEAMERLPTGHELIWKLTIPQKDNLYLPLINHPQSLRVLALSGGYSRAEACSRLARQQGMIASFSRALLEGLKIGMSEAEFDHTLKQSIATIAAAS